MSIKEIFFSITEYKPLKFDFSDFSFKFFSEETGFHVIIDFLDNKIISDKTERKGDLKYLITALKEGELIGITNLIIKKEIFSQKLNNINFKDLKFTISDYMIKKLFENSKIPNSQREILISINVQIKYLNKKLNFKKKFQKLKKNPTAQNRAISALKIREQNNMNFQFNNSSLSNRYDNSSFNEKKKTLMKTTSFINQFSSSKFNSFSFDSESSEESIIDSVLIDNEYTKEEEEENFEIKTKITFSNNDYPSDNELKGKIKNIMDKNYNLINEKNKYLMRVINKKKKLQNAYFNYCNKLNNILKKKEKLNQVKTNKKIQVELNRSNQGRNNVINNLIKGKEQEFSIINNIFNNYEKKDYQKNNIDKIIHLLLKTIQTNLDLDISLNDFFDNEGIRQFRIICQKYGLIESILPNQIKEDPNE